MFILDFCSTAKIHISFPKTKKNKKKQKTKNRRELAEIDTHREKIAHLKGLQQQFKTLTNVTLSLHV